MANRQYVIFKLAEESYGINIENINSISGVLPIVKVPNAPKHIQGVINLRGEIIPVISLQMLFGISETDPRTEARLIIYRGGEKLVGFMVDEASEVISIPTENIEPTPNFLQSQNVSLINGIGKVGDRIIVMLDFTDFLEQIEYREWQA